MDLGRLNFHTQSNDSKNNVNRGRLLCSTLHRHSHWEVWLKTQSAENQVSGSVKKACGRAHRGSKRRDRLGYPELSPTSAGVRRHTSMRLRSNCVHDSSSFQYPPPISKSIISHPNVYENIKIWGRGVLSFLCSATFSLWHFFCLSWLTGSEPRVPPCPPCPQCAYRWCRMSTTLAFPSLESNRGRKPEARVAAKAAVPRGQASGRLMRGGDAGRSVSASRRPWEETGPGGRSTYLPRRRPCSVPPVEALNTEVNIFPWIIRILRKDVISVSENPVTSPGATAY